MRFLHTKGHSPTLVARTAEYQVGIGGQFMLLKPAVYVKFTGAVATIEDDDPEYECKVAACRKADWVVAMGEDPRAKMSASKGEPVAKPTPVPVGAPASGVSAPSGPPRFSIPMGTGQPPSEVAVPKPTKKDLDEAAEESGQAPAEQ